MCGNRQWIKLGRSSQVLSKSLKLSVLPWQQERSLLRQQWLVEATQMKRMGLNTTLRICQWAGTVSRSRTGFTSCMVWAKNLSVRFVEAQAIGVDVPLRSISRSGAMHTVWSASTFPTPLISKTWQRSNMLWSSTKKSCRQTLRAHSNLTVRRSSRTQKEIYTHESNSSIWRDKVLSDN